MYGLAFLLLGLAPYGRTQFAQGWIQNVATAFYAMASSSGAFFFALNFGSEGQLLTPHPKFARLPTPRPLTPFQAAYPQKPGASGPA